MKLSKVNECVTTGAIAAPPAFGTRTKKRRKNKNRDKFTISDDYMKTAKGSLPKNKKTLVWQPLKSKRPSRWYNKYADVNNPDERLLKAFRGYGY